MKNLIWFIAIFILLVLQAGVLLPLHLSAANLILILVIIVALLSDFNFGVGLTLVSGLLLDFISGSADGIATMSLLSVFLLVYFVVNTVLSREANRWIVFTAIFGGTISYFIFFLL